MTSDVKGYVVQCEKESHRPGMPHEYIGHNATLGEAIADLYRALPHYDKGSIFRVHADGHEVRLPDLAEALAHLEAVHEVLAVSPGETATGAARRAAAELAQARAEIAAAHAMLDKHNAGNIVVDLNSANEIVDHPATLAERIEDVAYSAAQACSLLDKATGDVLRMSAEIERLRSIAPFLLEGVPAIMHSSAPSSREEIGAAACQMLKAIERALLVLRGSEQADPLAALEAAERRLLKAGGWREDRDGWVCPKRRLVWTIENALKIERRRLAAKKGSAQ